MKKGMQHRGTRQEGWLELGAERGVHVSIGFRHGVQGIFGKRKDKAGTPL
jgi:hypothetical protein